MKTLNNIKQIRWELGISTRQLAKMSGVSHAHITKLENFMCYPSQLTIWRLSRALNRNCDEVFLLDYKCKHVKNLLR